MGVVDRHSLFKDAKQSHDQSGSIGTAFTMNVNRPLA